MSDVIGSKAAEELTAPMSGERLHELMTDYANRTPTPEMVPVIEDLRQRCYDLALYLEVNLPRGRAKALAQTKLDEVRMWALNAAVMDGPIARPLQFRASAVQVR